MRGTADQLRAPIRACLAGENDHAAITVAATNRRGKTIACRITGSPLIGVNREARGVILVIDEEAPEQRQSPAVH